MKKPKIRFKLNISLISKTVDTSGEFIYLTDLINHDNCGGDFGSIKSINFYSFKYDINGIIFNRVSDYDLSIKGF